MLFSGFWGKMIHEKNLKKKILWQCPFNRWLIDIGHEIYDIDVAMFYIVLILSIYHRKLLS
jgi:hypothetical protein